MLELTSIAVDPTLSQEGVWADFLGGRFLLARRGHEYNARLGQLYNENLAVIKDKDNAEVSTKKVLEIYQRAFADTVLKDWEGITENGKKLEYTPEVGFRILSDPRQAELSTFLEQFSLNHGNYQAAVEAEVANDVKSSAVS
jgi:hypothetical protein